MKNSNKKVKAKSNNSKSFINGKGQLSGKKQIKKVDYSNAAIEGIYFPPEFYPSTAMIALFSMTADEIKYYPFLVAYYYLDFEELHSKSRDSRANMACAFQMAYPDYESGRDRLGDSIFTRKAKKELLWRLDFLTNLDKVSSN